MFMRIIFTALGMQFIPSSGHLNNNLHTIKLLPKIYSNQYDSHIDKPKYSLTDLGKSFVPILQDMKKWSDIHLM